MAALALETYAHPALDQTAYRLNVIIIINTTTTIIIITILIHQHHHHCLSQTYGHLALASIAY